LEALLNANEGTVPEFVQGRPFESFAPHVAAYTATATAQAAGPSVVSAAAIEAGLLPAAGGTGTATATTTTTPEMDYHRQEGQSRDKDEDEDDEDDEIVLAPALAGLSLRPA